MRWHTSACYSIAALFFIISSAYAGDACHQADYVSIEKRYIKGLLFTVQRCNNAPSYLFGTMHSGRPAVIQGAAAAFALLPQMRQTWFEEIASPQEGQAAALRHMFFAPGSTQRLSQLAGKDYFARLVLLSEPGHMTAQALERMRPWAAAVMLDAQLSASNGQVLDERLQQAARAQGKPVFGLETIESQLGLFDTLPLPVQLTMLKDAIDHYAQARQITQAMERSYIKRDARTLQQLAEKEMAGNSDDKQIDAFLRERVLLARNRAMEARLVPDLRQGNIFVAVGALHLLGEGGILQLLERDGYEVISVQ